jgi:hypothetical protein
MKKNFINLALVLMIGAVILSSCNENRPFGDSEKQAVRDTINQLMGKVMEYAGKANADSTFQWLSDDSSSIFVSGRLAYPKSGLISMFRSVFSDLKQQKIDQIRSQVLVFSPSSAAWIAVANDNYELKNQKKGSQYLVETWIWQRETAGWKVVHYHESVLRLPDESVKTEVEKGLAGLADQLRGKSLTPDEMPAILTGFLKKNPVVYGSTLAFAPKEADGKRHVAAPYIYRAGSEFKQVELPESYDYTVSEWYMVPVKTKTASWSNPYFDAGGGGVLMVTYSIPVFENENNLTGVLTCDLELK